MSFHVKRCKKASQNFFDFFENWHREFLAKNRHLFFIKAKKPHTKRLQGYQLLDFRRFLHHTFFDNSTSYYRRNWCLGAFALERYFIEQNLKNSKN
jgi:hypothetical protein